MKSEKIITHAKITINPKFLQEILPKAKETREKILLETGCETFILTTKKENENTLVIFAVYTSQQTYDWHLEQDYVKSFFGFLDGKLENVPAVTYLKEV
jgi:quinol monooxygenase YgiN